MRELQKYNGREGKGLSDIQKLIDDKIKAIEELKSAGTSHMSATGVKWALQTNREELSRLRDWLKRKKSQGTTDSNTLA